MNREKTTGKKCRGRPATFDRDQLITQVMELFWERGYANLSLNEVARATGLTRASLYNAFATKEALFLEAIRQYQADSPEKILDTIGDDEPVGPALYRMFDTISRHLAADSKHRGCLAVNCMTEQFPDNTELGTALAAMHKRKRRMLTKVIEKAVARQELPESTDVEVSANILQAFLNGLSVYSKNGAAAQELLAMSRTFLRSMGFVEPPSKE